MFERANKNAFILKQNASQDHFRLPKENRKPKYLSLIYFVSTYTRTLVTKQHQYWNQFLFLDTAYQSVPISDERMFGSFAYITLVQTSQQT